MKRRQLKHQVVSLLQRENLAAVNQNLSSYDQKSLVSPLISCLCHTDERVRWYSVSALGPVINAIAAQEFEAARLVMRRFLWMLNDESGGIGWGVPEALSEAMYHNERLAAEYMHMLVSYARSDGPELFQDGNFIELPLLQRGVLWGLCRLAEKYREQLVNIEAHENIGFYLSSEDAQVRGMASLLCGRLGRGEFMSSLQLLSEDPETVWIYMDGQLVKHSVGTLARAALSTLKGSQ